MRRQPLVPLILLLAAPAVAEMQGGEYLPDKTLDSRERDALRERIEEERNREAERARQREAATLAEQARQAEARARRPLAERLFEERCGLCHAPEQLAHIRHTRLGWQMVIARMRWLNGAPLTLAEGNLLASYLAQRQGAQGVAAVLEWVGWLVATSLLFLGAWLGLRRVAGRRR